MSWTNFAKTGDPSIVSTNNDRVVPRWRNFPRRPINLPNIDVSGFSWPALGSGTSPQVLEIQRDGGITSKVWDRLSVIDFYKDLMSKLDGGA